MIYGPLLTLKLWSPSLNDSQLSPDDSPARQPDGLRRAPSTCPRVRPQLHLCFRDESIPHVRLPLLPEFEEKQTLMPETGLRCGGKKRGVRCEKSGWVCFCPARRLMKESPSARLERTRRSGVRLMQFSNGCLVWPGERGLLTVPEAEPSSTTHQWACRWGWGGGGSRW